MQSLGKPHALWRTSVHRFERKPSAFAVRQALCMGERCEQLE
jgi:hypothetical protein